LFTWLKELKRKPIHPFEVKIYIKSEFMPDTVTDTACGQLMTG
jgi:hypothetical protein